MQYGEVIWANEDSLDRQAKTLGQSWKLKNYKAITALFTNGFTIPIYKVFSKVFSKLIKAWFPQTRYPG